MALYDIEPWGDDWSQAGMICATLRSSLTGEPTSAADFVPTAEGREVATVDDTRLVQTWANRLGF